MTGLFELAELSIDTNVMKPLSYKHRGICVWYVAIIIIDVPLSFCDSTKNYGMG